MTIEAAALAADVVKMCAKRGWSMHWTHRGAYLHLESSELIEAIRGKHGDPLHEAADVLLVLMSITEYHGIPWGDVERQARAKCDEMMMRPRYAGEEHDGREFGEPGGPSAVHVDGTPRVPPQSYPARAPVGKHCSVPHCTRESPAFVTGISSRDDGCREEQKRIGACPRGCPSVAACQSPEDCQNGRTG